ncbi:MAG: methyltransferase domain-containing protein [Chloroflexi bacterium]|nr:methyltransferase domain-containing protein [Chloroflexota bacterium]
MTTPKDQMRAAFTAQADSYVNSAVIAADEARRAFVQFVGPRASDRVLDVATGPGFLALLFAPSVAEVVGVDLTPAMVARAEADRLAQRAANVRIQEGDAEALPFPDAHFDIITCGSAFHHFGAPARVLSEMVRVARPGGRVALIDIITSQDVERAALHNRLERERDPSHVRSLSLNELVALFAVAGLRDVRTHQYGTPRELGEWFAISRTPPDVSEQIRAAFIASIPGDRTGLGVHLEGAHVCFTHTFAWVVGTKR